MFNLQKSLTVTKSVIQVNGINSFEHAVIKGGAETSDSKGTLGDTKCAMEILWDKNNAVRGTKFKT